MEEIISRICTNHVTKIVVSITLLNACMYSPLLISVEQSVSQLIVIVSDSFNPGLFPGLDWMTREGSTAATLASSSTFYPIVAHWSRRFHDSTIPGSRN